ncbi:glycogen debranching protein GlgX [Sulfuracidifex metallicus]|uniref:glycogen debranching protein GlgX n=1 Tax=Sulfuracidifex metallicus TaxID=47303 RepID=UPI0006D146AB|nr:glycogen debranching protein GlgX [Sulfuracidifex metallicus]
MVDWRDVPLRPGNPYPLGSTWLEEEDGVNFSLFSENATKVEILLFSRNKKYPKEVIEVRNRMADIWHTFVPGIRPGHLYAYRVHGPYKPEEGLRFNPNKALIDPYAKAISGSVEWDDSLFAYKIGDQREDLSFDERDSSPFIPKSVVIDPNFNWDDHHFKRFAWNRTVIYELHVKGFTKLREDLDENIRGSYKALASDKVTEYLKDLGITSVELMPVHHFVDDRFLVEKGLKNYWGYNTIGFFAPECRYSSSGCGGEQVKEFKEMVNALHNAGLEVILDVVFNHTAEGNHMGPTLSFKGIDNLSYYMLSPENRRYYLDYTGVGNTLNMSHPRVLQMVLDSLRYWVTEMHVDGFRFDLAAALARELYSVNMLSTFFIAIQQDPVLSMVKLIAEPWDVGPGGYQVGNFPPFWAEWNGKYRDTVRKFWRGDSLPYQEIANRIMGSPDIYLGTGKTPYASVNYVTSHDGFTLQDLVSYNSKHNEANGLNNQDGTNENFSWNCGFEGETNDPNVIACRERMKRNFIITLFISEGIPMLLGGDELSRTQRGNNNAFCQDNEISWVRWNLSDGEYDFLNFVRRAVKFYDAHPIFRRAKYFQGKKLLGMPFKDVTWYKVNGEEVDENTWSSPTKILVLVLEGGVIDEHDELGNRIADDTFLIIMNSDQGHIKVKIPGHGKWNIVLHSYMRHLSDKEKEVNSGEELEVEGKSVLVYRRVSS